MADVKVRVPLWNSGLRRIPLLVTFLEGRPALGSLSGGKEFWLGWGRKRSAKRAGWYASATGGTVVRLEDGMLRSFGPGKYFPPLSLVVDDKGIYYDSTGPSVIESLLSSELDVVADITHDISRARVLLLKHLLSKYNHALPWNNSPRLVPSRALGGRKMGKRVLVVDQTAGDMSVSLGGASPETFAEMLAAARSENPGAILYVKAHPEVASGRKAGYLTHVQDDDRTVVLRDPINPLSLIEQMDRVYVVTSTMGFEALLAGKPVSVFGMPWYAGWGVTDDRQICPRRTRKRSVDELFAAAYFHYTRYLDPVTHKRGTIFDVIGWLVRQREMADKYAVEGRRPRMVCVGFRRWKAPNVKPLLSLEPDKVSFVRDARGAQAMGIQTGDCLIHWGRDAPAGVAELAKHTDARVLRMEDGFVRSVGLGSDFIRPLSVVLDERGIYFDATRPSDLEHLLNTEQFSQEELARARAVRDFIVAHGITKYNLEPREQAVWPSAGKPVVLVPGQVEDDASILYGCRDVKTNLGLLKAARAARPDAFVVYKPHPDVASGNRAGRLALDQARELADHVETRLSVVSCIDACDEVHTMTSLTGFDALLRGKRVVVYGEPFYAGWGLTEDVLRDSVAFARRTRRLMLDELVAGALLRYPIYWDWDLKGYTTCEAALHRIVETRSALEANGGLEKLRAGVVRRQLRKVRILTRAWVTKV